MNTLHRLDGRLHLEGVALDTLAERFGTPLYVYSRQALESAYQAYSDAFAETPHLICYAVKANSSLAILNLFARLGAGFDIVSGGELARVLAAGGDPGKAVFSGVGKTVGEMRAALEAGIFCFNVESVSELHRLNRVAVTPYPRWLGPFFRGQERRYGEVLLPGLLWARVPRLFAAVALLYGAIDRRSSPLSPLLRSPVTVRVSQINDCRFCVDINSMTAARRAGSMDKVDALGNWRDSSLFEERERVALEYAEAMTDSNGRVTDELFARLRAAFDDDAIIELTGLIAFRNLSRKFNSALDVPSQGFCQIQPPVG